MTQASQFITLMSDIWEHFNGRDPDANYQARVHGATRLYSNLFDLEPGATWQFPDQSRVVIKKHGGGIKLVARHNRAA